MYISKFSFFVFNPADFYISVGAILIIFSEIFLKNETIKLANPRGFCAGVDRAIDIVERAIDKFGPPVCKT